MSQRGFRTDRIRCCRYSLDDFRENISEPANAGRLRLRLRLVRLRGDVLSIGAYQYEWLVGWPGSGILDNELRERVFAILFTALRGQYLYLGRLLMVVDIVLQELLLGTRQVNELSLGTLIERFGYPDPEDPAVRGLFSGETNGR